MLTSRSKIILVAAASLLALLLGTANAQLVVDKKTFLNQRNAVLSHLSARQQQTLSSGTQRVMQLVNVLNDPHTKNADSGTVNVPPALAALATAAAQAAPLGPIPGPGPGGTIRVSDPRLDFVNSTMSGFTQSETSTAWCGNNIVAGYNDSGAFARTAGVVFDSAWSFSTASYSHDGGQTFTSIGYLNPGTDPANFIAGDPVIACTSPTRFYYSSIYASFKDSLGNFVNGVAVNISSDGGVTWSNPIAAVTKDLNHGIDKPWIAADPTNSHRLFVTYTDFDFSGFAFPPDPSAHCPNDFRTAIELVTSNDSGATWSAPVVVDEECESTANASVQGSNPAVAGDGTLYVGYEFFPFSVPNNEIHLARSTNHGTSFNTPVNVSNVWPNGNFGLMQGGFRNNEFPQVAVDRSHGSSRGTVYLAWSDGINNIVPDLPKFFDSYAYPDIVVAKSIDRGNTFTVPQVVSPMSSSFHGKGRDQVFPGLAVDRDAHVGVCYYDRRQNPLNLLMDRYCSVSQNHGRTWNESRVSRSSWVPAHSSDGVINTTYIGDYDALTGDFLLQHDGFYGSFEVQINGNPDVVGAPVD